MLCVIKRSVIPTKEESLCNGNELKGNLVSSRSVCYVYISGVSFRRRRNLYVMSNKLTSSSQGQYAVYT
jgi:hypothetical protein